ncbi:MAG TPA: DUF4340 domain-containing protein [Anaerolineae bacterium]|nr:DUF4340 domain-containing protein [Anaerolineae bacterium]HQI84391.1 DUF4340 domain-containing protein [Anaerolineae bacterium]
MKRHQQILAGVLILQIILGVITFWPRSAATGSSKPVFAELKAEDITALTITDDQGVSITMRKSGDGWVLPNAGDYPVQASKITPILEKLTKLNTASLVTRTEASYKQLKVSNDDFVRRIDFETADGKTYMLYLGSAPRYTATHFRVVGQTETYLTTELSTWQLYTAPASWVDTAYAKIDAATLTEIVLENANGAFTLVKSGDAWTLADLAEGEVVAAGKINDVVSKATNVMMQRPLGTTEEASYGLGAPTAVVTLKNADGGTYTLRVGAKFDGTNYAVKSSESSYYVAVTEYNVKPLVENTRASFLQEPTPTPTPQP